MARMIGRTKSWLAWIAGSLLAFIFGSAGCGQSDPSPPLYGVPPKPPAGATTVKPAKSLDETAEWQRISALWTKSQEPNFYQVYVRTAPHDKQPYLEELIQAGKDVDALQAAGALHPSEAAWLKGELGHFKKRFVNHLLATCYDPVPYYLEAESADRLSARLPLLERMVQDGKLHPAVIAKVLASVESDLARLADVSKVKSMPEKRRTEAKNACDAVKAEVEKLKKLLEASKP